MSINLEVVAPWPMGSWSLPHTVSKILRKFPMHQFLIYSVAETSRAHCLDLCSFLQIIAKKITDLQ